MVRVRIAPSPTGLFHVGTARTALYNWLFARNKKGTFVLRIEDTDVKRSTEKMVDVIVDSLRWLGLDWDEGPIFQSERLNLYREYTEKLVTKGVAYPCYCTDEELKARRRDVAKVKGVRGYDRKCWGLSDEEKLKFEREGRPKALRFFVPEGRTSWIDGIHGYIEKQNSEIDDFVIMKSDGRPTYNLAVVVDDAEMGMTHVIRGDDHIANTPKQLMLYEALGIAPPEFVHLPLILGEDRAKFSKRHGSVAVTDYRKQGYMPEALVNFLALLGWSPGDDREIMTKEELVSAFSLERVIKRGAIFDMKKLVWMNGEYITRLGPDDLLREVTPWLTETGLVNDEWLAEERSYTISALELMKSRIKVLSDFGRLGDYFFTEDYHIEEEGVGQHIDKEAIERLSLVREKLAALDSFKEEEIEGAVRELAAELSIKPALLIHPIRLSVTGKRAGPGLFEILEVLGNERVVTRIERFVALSSSQA